MHAQCCVDARGVYAVRACCNDPAAGSRHFLQADGYTTWHETTRRPVAFGPRCCIVDGRTAWKELRRPIVPHAALEKDFSPRTRMTVRESRPFSEHRMIPYIIYIDDLSAADLRSVSCLSERSYTVSCVESVNK
jgi:hypothetical protein